MIREPAGFWIRLLALILDAIIIAIPIGLIISMLGTENNIIGTIIGLLYNAILPIVWNGYTVGKRIMGIRIVKVNGDKLGLGTMLLRTVVSELIYGITLGITAIVSAFMVAFRKDKRALHDFIAGTYVTKEKPSYY